MSPDKLDKNISVDKNTRFILIIELFCMILRNNSIHYNFY